MNIPGHLRPAIIQLGDLPSASNVVGDDTLRQLASQGLINYDAATGQVKFTDIGKFAYWELTGQLPTRNV